MKEAEIKPRPGGKSTRRDEQAKKTVRKTAIVRKNTSVSFSTQTNNFAPSQSRIKVYREVVLRVFFSER